MGYLDPPIAAIYGAIDSDAIADGGPANAHIIRELVRSTNRLLAQGEPMLSLTFDASTDAADNSIAGALHGVALPNLWLRLYPGSMVAPKKSTHLHATMKVEIRIPTGEDLWIQVCTLARPFLHDADSTSDNVEVLTAGDGTYFQRITGPRVLPLGPHNLEGLHFYIRSDSAEGLMNEGTYGTNNEGSVTSATTTSFTDSSSAWDPAITGDSHYVTFFNGLEPITYPREVSYSSGTTLNFLPALTAAELSLLSGGAPYQLARGVVWRMASLDLWTQDLT